MRKKYGNIRTIEEIKQKIQQGTARILTAHELAKEIQSGNKVKFEDVDVVTTATKGLMSGTSMILSFRISKPKEYKKIHTITLNGVPAFPGPAPNESLGIVDLTVYGTEHSVNKNEYGGGHLFRDLVVNKPIRISAISDEGIEINASIRLEEMDFAQLLGSRHAFRNYNAFTNPGNKKIKTIFSVTGMKPNNVEATVCGVGSYNPIENDPQLETIGIGTSILVNGARGYILGHGTRSTNDRPNLFTIAPVKLMKPEYMGGFVTSSGPEVIVSIAIPIPILNENIFDQVLKADSDIPINIVDVVGRNVIGQTTYADVWGKNESSLPIVSFTVGFCESCELNHECPIEQNCPMSCFTISQGIDKSICFNCGACINLCPYHAFQGSLGVIHMKNGDIPITLRQSDRVGAIKLMNLLKKEILAQKFELTTPLEKIHHDI